MEALSQAAGGSFAAPFRAAYLVEECDNPTSAYFLLPALNQASCRVQRLRFNSVPTAAELDGALVIFARYVPPLWRRCVTANLHRLAGLVYFMDDDLFDPLAWHGMPWRYQLKLFRLAASRKRWLRDSGATLWVSTPYLCVKYRSWHPRLVSPVALDREEESKDIRRVFYHGTASHQREINWLRPVVETILAQNEHLCFEIIGTRAEVTAYRSLDRTVVVHAMNWPNYRRFAVSGQRHVGLAPLLDTPFNRPRSHVKFFDITRTGAVGVYTAGSACARVVEDGYDGIVVPMDPQAWIDAVQELSRDDARRRVMLARARDKVLGLSQAARREHAGLFSEQRGTE